MTIKQYFILSSILSHSENKTDNPERIGDKNYYNDMNEYNNTNSPMNMFSEIEEKISNIIKRKKCETPACMVFSIYKYR